MAEALTLTNGGYDGLYIARRNGEIQIEVLSKSQKGEPCWSRIDYTIDLFDNDIKDLLTSFFILNANHLR